MTTKAETTKREVPFEIKRGGTYLYDGKNDAEVVVVRIYGKLFCRVKDPNNISNEVEWDCMINRLIPLPANRTS